MVNNSPQHIFRTTCNSNCTHVAGALDNRWTRLQHLLTHLLPLLQQHLQPLRRLLGLVLLALGVVLALRVVEVDAEVEGDVDKRRHQLHRYSTETSDVTYSVSAR